MPSKSTSRFRAVLGGTSFSPVCPIKETEVRYPGPHTVTCLPEALHGRCCRRPCGAVEPQRWRGGGRPGSSPGPALETTPPRAFPDWFLEKSLGPAPELPQHGGAAIPGWPVRTEKGTRQGEGRRCMAGCDLAGQAACWASRAPISPIFSRGSKSTPQGDAPLGFGGVLPSLVAGVGPTGSAIGARAATAEARAGWDGQAGEARGLQRCAGCRAVTGSLNQRRVTPPPSSGHLPIAGLPVTASSVLVGACSGSAGWKGVCLCSPKRSAVPAQGLHLFVVPACWGFRASGRLPVEQDRDGLSTVSLCSSLMKTVTWRAPGWLRQ